MPKKWPISYRSVGLMAQRMLPVGSKVWFYGEKQAYTVRASNAAFVILNKPFNARKTVLYCIIDWESGVRGPEDLIFGMGAETKRECEEMLERLTTGKSSVSSRHCADLIITKYQHEGIGKIYEVGEE